MLLKFFLKKAQFISELPFMDGKFDEEDVCRIHKRKTIFQVGKALPYITNRIEVISELEVTTLKL